MFGLLLALAAAAAPQPSVSPLKTIVHLRATPLCSALGQNIFRAVEGLRINDNMVSQGRLMFVKMKKDLAAGGGAMVMDNVLYGVADSYSMQELCSEAMVCSARAIRRLSTAITARRIQRGTSCIPLRAAALRKIRRLSRHRRILRTVRMGHSMPPPCCKSSK